MDLEPRKQCDLSHTSGRAGTHADTTGLFRGHSLSFTVAPARAHGAIDHQRGASPLSGFFLGVATTAAAPIGLLLHGSVPLMLRRRSDILLSLSS
jgi:hypothetical protein